jgi:RNA polymerase subunit RPABC4/transcription elongation factor Spt4
MFFFIGGVQPKTVTLEETPRLCPACGLAQARLRRIDHYLSLFFIPLFPVKRGDPVVVCDRCGTVSTPGEPMWRTAAPGPPAGQCSRCGFVLERDFKYCPNCGVRI